MNLPARCQDLAPALVLAFLMSSVATAESRLSITGYVDRTTVDREDKINVTVIVANTGDTAAQNCKIEIIPGPVPCEPSDFALAPKQEQAVRCNFTPGHEGAVNIVAIGSWKEADVSRATGQLISQLNVSSPSWYRRPDLQVLAVTALLIVAALLWKVIFLGTQASFPRVLGALVSVSLVGLVSGILLRDGVVIISGLILLLVCGLLIILGEKGTKKLILRVKKAGPLEFSIAVERSRHFAVVDAREQDFKRPKARLEQARLTGRSLSFYVDLYRLKIFTLESRLVPHSTPAPPLGFPTKARERRVWFDSVAATTTTPLDQDAVKELRQLYRVMQGYEEIVSLFDDQIVTLLDAAQAAKEKTDKVNQAITLLEQFRNKALTDNFVCPPNCFVILAHLQVVLEKKEAAFSILYQSQNEFETQFVANVVSNYALCHYLMDLANDSYTALGYGDNALNYLRKLEKDFLSWKKECDRLSAVATGAFPLHLKTELQPYVDQRYKEIKEWLERVRHGMKNLVAYTIATSGLTYREDDAKAYAKAIVCYDPNPSYLDTMGFVKLTFGIANRDRAEVNDAWKLFHRAAQEFNKSGTKYERQLSHVHLERATEVLRSGEDWD